MKLKPSILRWPIFIVAALVFLWLKKFGLHYTATGDENAYFYMARLMAEGKLFYRDFFFAHPPLQLLLLALVYSLVGFNFVILKLTAALPVLVGSAFIYHQLWRKGRGMAAVFFLGTFLFNYELLKITTHPFGLNLTACFLMLSLYFFLEERPLPCGLFWGFASITGFYALPWGMVPFVYFALHPPSHKHASAGSAEERGSTTGLPVGLHRQCRLASVSAFLGGFLLIFGLTNLAFGLLFGEAYLTPVFFYHFLKPRGAELVVDIIIRVVRRNVLLFFLPFLYIWAPKSKRKNAVLIAGLIYLIFLVSLNPLFTQYFMLPLPYLTWIGAVALSGWIGRVKRAPLRPVVTIVAIIVLAAFGADNVRRYLIHEGGTDFRNVEYCRRFILKNTTEDDLLFGHVTTVPLLALLTGRDIALNEVDTNHMRFKAGLPPFGEVAQRLKEEPRLKFFIIQENRFWLEDGPQAFLENCKPVALFEEPRERIVFYDCRGEVEQ